MHTYAYVKKEKGMYNASKLAYKTIGGDWVYPSDNEVDRVMRDNAKVSKAIQAKLAKSAWTYWSKVSQGKKGGN